MASFAALTRRLELNTPVKGIGGMLLDTGIGAGASYGIGRLYSQKRDKWYGKNAARLAAGVGKLGAVAAFFITGGPNFVSGSLNAVGQSGVDALFLDMGLRHGREKSGVKAVLVDKNKALPPGATEVTPIGELGNTPAGRGMSWDAIQELAAGV